MLPETSAPTEQSFADECAERFRVACHARSIAPFHADKKKYEAEAWLHVDAYLDWQELQQL